MAVTLLQQFFDLRPAGGFGLIMADPPWNFATRSDKGITAKGAGGQYSTQPLGWVAALPVPVLAADDTVTVEARSMLFLMDAPESAATTERLQR